ncbi:permease-like cell division protein FtsX [Hathewaya histolytica]|uniref:Cell division protein FtsX n=2 Tax=Hathewaya histolytica TaxID=1498 RepID=A0A4U9QY45_HATHI|nr:cell division protein [Hathewaya histolytica]
MNRGEDIVMKTSNIKYFVIESVKSLRRNRTLSFASVATVMATLFIFGVFMMSMVTINGVIDQVGSNLQADIYLKDEVTKEQLKKVKDTIQSVEGISNIEFEDKKQALENAKKRFGEDGEELVKGLEENNPFPMAYIVTVSKPEQISKVVEAVKDVPGVQKIRDVRAIANKIQRISQSLNILGVGMFSILIFVSIFLIGNTIKLAVFSRRREIGIMKFVGATDWFIRWPFIIEGMLIGFFGSILSTTLLYYIYKIFVYGKLMDNLFVKLVNPSYILVNLSWKFVIAGAIIGALGSILSIRKYLKV